MQRILLILGCGILAAILVLIAMSIVSDPLGAKRAQLAQDLQNVPAVMEFPEATPLPFSEWEGVISDKIGVWDALVPPPPPPKPPPPPPPTPPDIRKMLEGVKASKHQVGSKVKIITPESPRGTFYEAGDTVKGCTLKSFDRNAVTFSFFWREGNKELSHVIARE